MNLQLRLSDLQKRMAVINKRLDALERPRARSDRASSLYTKQEAILQRIRRLEPSGDKAGASSTEARLSQELTGRGVRSYSFQKVPDDYYKEDLEFRRECLQAASVQHLCKSLVYENPKLPLDADSSEAQDFRFYLVIVQYAAKFHGEKVKRFLHKTNGKLGVQYFRPRQAPAETSEKLSGYPSGSVTPVGLRTPLPLIMSHEIANLQPDFFWMGGGEELLKLGVNVKQFIEAYEPFVIDCTY